MTDWITDRRPTDADADGDGYVRVPRRPISEPDGSLAECSYQHWALIVPGQPWWSQRASAVDRMRRRVAGEKAAAAEPAPKPEYSDPMEQARLEHLRAKTLLLQAQAYALTHGEPGQRSIVQIAVDTATRTASHRVIYALCDDGSLWSRHDFPGNGWERLPGVPGEDGEVQ